jgi:hypothetical protein
MRLRRNIFAAATWSESGIVWWVARSEHDRPRLTVEKHLHPVRINAYQSEDRPPLVCEPSQSFRLTNGVFTVPDAELVYAAAALLAAPSSAEAGAGCRTCLRARRVSARYP